MSVPTFSPFLRSCTRFWQPPRSFLPRVPRSVLFSFHISFSRFNLGPCYGGSVVHAHRSSELYSPGEGEEGFGARPEVDGALPKTYYCSVPGWCPHYLNHLVLRRFRPGVAHHSLFTLTCAVRRCRVCTAALPRRFRGLYIDTAVLWRIRLRPAVNASLYLCV